MLSTIGVNTAYQNMVNILKVDTADINRTTSNRRDNKVVRELVRPYCITIRGFGDNYFITNTNRVINLPFALAELIWIIAGSDDDSIVKYNKQVGNYLDIDNNNRPYFNAAYGHRMRKAFGIDQLLDVVHHFDKDKYTRQAAIAYRSPFLDVAFKDTKDRACNLLSMFSYNEDSDKLNMSQVSRSNDVIWGVPYNFIQFGHIFQAVSEMLKINMGDYTYFTNNLHVYEPFFKDIETIEYEANHYKVPAIGADLEILYFLNDKYLLDYCLSAIENSWQYHDVDLFIIQNMVPNSPFWQDALVVLLSYWRKHDVDWCLETLESLNSDLFKVLAHRYYYTYFDGFKSKITL